MVQTPLTLACVATGRMSSTTVGDRLERLFPDDKKCAQVLAAFSDLPSEKGDRLLLGNDRALKIALETLLTAPAQGASIAGCSAYQCCCSHRNLYLRVLRVAAQCTVHTGHIALAVKL